ncbi:MAG: SDR family NAD(P)-dependent oxidoreductase [Streptococcaceae bacterium]|jgi:NAD(P)-dependent dehydrogenase (short-subunit alcohol dehydrogenase family)|nr:SDR family NAD(P)-dependent oxidoreductase [Streptococcaceae bacterium]
MTEKKVVIITGASNGMGFEATKLFASKDWQVVAGARRVEKIPQDDKITAVKLDVTQSESNKAFVQTALDKYGRIDVLINNAGYGEYGPAEEISMDNIRKQFETNFFGAVELSQLVLPTMRAQKSGRIINISSIGGNIYMPFGAFYHATKGALQQWSDALDMEVEPFGVRSLIVQPGGTQSAWGEIAMQNAIDNLKEGSVYRQAVEDLKRGMARLESGSGGATSADLAALFYQAATDAKPKLRYFNAFSDRMMVRVGKAHPRIFRKVMGSMIKRFSK